MATSKQKPQKPKRRRRGTQATKIAIALQRDKLKTVFGLTPEQLAEIQPLDFILLGMRDPTLSMWARFECAQAAAPYLHRKQPRDVILGGKVEIRPLVVEIAGIEGKD